MARVKVQLADNIKRVVFVDPDATIGATLGTDLKMPDGSIATATSLATYLGVSNSPTTQAHRLLSGLTLGDDHPQYTRKDTLTARGDLYVRSATTIARLAIGTASQFFQSNGTDPAWQTISPTVTLGTDLSGGVTLTNLTSGTLNATIVSHAITNGKIRQSGALSVIGNSTNATADVADISASADGDVLRRNGTTLGFGNIGADPTASVGLTAVNGTANTYLRSDAAPALDVSISPTWSGTHTFSNIPVVPDQSWTYAKIQDVSATSRFLGRVTTGAGTMEELTGTQATTLLDVATVLLKGLVPAPGSSTGKFLQDDLTWASAGSGSGTVTSVAFSDASTSAIYSVSGTPVTTSGTLTITLATQSANKVFAGPTTGSAAQPAFRSLVLADIPTIPLATKISGVLGVANGGTGSANANVIAIGGNITTDGAFALSGAFTTALTVTANTSVTLPTSGMLATTSQLPAAASPSASIGLTAINGTATTFMRSDAAPALDVSISPTWTGTQLFTGSSPITATGTSSRATIGIGAGRPGVVFDYSAAASANNRVTWLSNFSATTFAARFVSDDGLTGNNFLMATRSGASVTDVTFGNSTNNPSYTFSGTGIVKWGNTATGAQTATFVAANKPGSGTSGPIAWISVQTAGGTQGYIPIFGA